MDEWSQDTLEWKKGSLLCGGRGVTESGGFFQQGKINSHPWISMFLSEGFSAWSIYSGGAFLRKCQSTSTTSRRHPVKDQIFYLLRNPG